MKKITPQIEYKSVLQGIENIVERNTAFHELNDQSKRLEIAWECLQLILKGEIKGSKGWYWSGNLALFRKLAENPMHFQHLLLNLPEKQCSVCARGGMMLAQIRLGNTISTEDLRYAEGSPSNIQGFSIEDFHRMEEEYEKSYYKHPYTNNTTEKLANICCNVLINGNFNVKDKTDYLAP